MAWRDESASLFSRLGYCDSGQIRAIGDAAHVRDRQAVVGVVNERIAKFPASGEINRSERRQAT